jgi:hypothetical protein
MSADGGSEQRRLKIIPPVAIESIPLEARMAAATYATMLFPDEVGDAKARLAAAYLLGLRWHTLNGDVEVMRSEWAARPVATRSEMLQVLSFFECSSRDDAMQRAQRGRVAGDVLAVIVWSNLHEPGKASLKRAIYLVEQLNRFPEEGAGPAKRLSGPTIKRYWREFRTVSHLWAGWAEDKRQWNRVLESEGQGASAPGFGAFDRFLSTPAAALTFADSYLRYVTNYFPPHQKRPSPILHWEDVWLLPRRFLIENPPEFFDPAKLYTGLTERVAQVLSEYRHE